MNRSFFNFIGLFGSLFLVALFCLLLTSCSETVSGNTEIKRQGVFDAVSSIADLPKCDAENNGLQVFVQSDSSIRVCADGDWFAAKNGMLVDSTMVIFSECTTVPLSDSNGVKILCNGDSVGAVYNGKDGMDGSDGKKGDKGNPGVQGNAGADGVDGNDGAGCTAVTLPENKGLKVLCNGDSVGVVLNGKDGVEGNPGKAGSDGKNGENFVVSCNLMSVNCIMNVVCGIDTLSLNVVADGETCKDVLVLDSEAVALNLDGIVGSSQKGPFLMGSEVLAYELLDGRTLQQTGKTFQGKILSDKGDFDIKTVTLTSQYATLMVKGFYLNEVTGKPSNSQISLTALTNLRGRAIANVNLLTHLENERAQYLVLQEKKNVSTAKKLAEREIFNLFHIDASNFGGYSEDLSVGGTSDADAALLAISILLQGDRTEAELSALLTTISSSMKESGTWKDDSTMIKLAGWAMNADTLGKLNRIRNNVADWKLSQMVAKFEPFIRNFWYTEVGLGECGNDSVAVGTVAKPSRGIFKQDDRFICIDSSDIDVGRVWRVATDFEKDTYRLEPREDGLCVMGLVNTEKPYIYDVSLASWRIPANVAEHVLGACQKNREGETGKANGRIFVCKTGEWAYTYNFVIDTNGWVPGSDGSIKTVDGVDFVFDEAEGQWQKAVTGQVIHDFMGCTTNRFGEIVLDTVRESSSYGKYFMCGQDKVWKAFENKSVVPNVYGIECDSSGKMVLGRVIVNNHFVCEDGSWREATASEESLKRSCLTSMENSVEKLGDSYYVCSSHVWKLSADSVEQDYVPKFYDYTVGEWDYFSKRNTAHYVDTLFVDPRDGKKYKLVRIIVDNYDRTWFAENLRFADSSAYEYLKGQSWCYREKNGDCTIGGRYYTWTAAMNIHSKWQNVHPYDVVGVISNPHQGICPDGWHVPGYMEFEELERTVLSLYSSGSLMSMEYGKDYVGFSALPTGSYEKKNFNGVGTNTLFWTKNVLESKEYDYENTIGLSAIAARFLGRFVSDQSMEKQIGMPIRCIQDLPEKFDEMTCSKDASLVSGVVYVDEKYVCDAGFFRKISYLENKLGVGCTIYNENEILFLGGSAYVCNNSQWIFEKNIAQEDDYRTLSCPEDQSIVSGLINPKNKYVCDNGSFRLASSLEQKIGFGCSKDNEGFSLIVEDEGYICQNSKWSVDPKGDFRTISCPEDKSVVSGLINPDNKYVCEDGNIRGATTDEITMGYVCEENLVAYSVNMSSYNSPVDFICKEKAWSPMYLYAYTLEQWDIFLKNNTPSNVAYGSLTDSRDGHVYKTLTFDGVEWMAENLQYADSSRSENLIENSKCHGNLDKNCVIGGRLYTWSAAMDLPSSFNSTYAHESGVDSSNHQGICPDGWRIPTAGEWKSLVEFIGNANDMEITGMVTWDDANNKSGFSILPSEYYYNTDVFSNSTYQITSFFWATTEYESSPVPASMIVFYPGGYSIARNTKSYGLSVRCIKK